MVREAEALFPARSTAVPVATCPDPSVVTAAGPGQAAIPDSLSEQEKVMFTSVLFQPFALGRGLWTAVIRGGVTSTVVTVSGTTGGSSWFPARSRVTL